MKKKQEMANKIAISHRNYDEQKKLDITKKTSNINK